MQKKNALNNFSIVQVDLDKIKEQMTKGKKLTINQETTSKISSMLQS